MIKKKRLNDVYMREVTKSKIKTIFNEELNAYVTYKHSIDTTFTCKVYVNGKRKVIFDKGYTILEYSPLNEKYNVRVFIDKDDNILQYYFDVIKDFEIENDEIYYNDMYLDVLYHLPYFAGTSYIELADENELIDSYKKGEIDKDTFDYCYKVAEKLMNELSKGNNRFVNRGIKDYLKMKEE
ncbi:MAG: DUF402 domain-containing protein [Bacilli bacterium]|nr:DUF402 domain-containing protein [Bacilli bacterium]